MSEFVCQTWRVEDGLPQNSVMAIVQTRDGYIWLGTANGLARFDGVRFKRFGLAEGLSSLQVRVLLEDREGGLWVGTAKGLSRYRNGQFTSWTARDGLAGDMIMALAQDREGAIWIGTSTGSSRWHRGRFERIDATEEVANGYVRTLIADRNGVVWISLTKPGLTRWDGRKLVVVADWPKAFGVAPYQLMQDRAGRMWAGSVGRVTVGDGNSWKTYGPEAGVPRAKITSLAEDARGTIWAGSIDQGLYYLQAERFHRVDRSDGLSDDAVQVVMEDRERNLWVGMRSGGLNQLRLRQLSTRKIMDGNTELTLGSLAEAADGSLWVGTVGRGFYRLEEGKPEQRLSERPVVYQQTQAALATSDGSVWTSAGGVLSQWREGRMVSAYGAGTRLGSNIVSCLCEERKGGMWVGSRNGALMLLSKGEFIPVTNGVPGAELTALVQQPDGTLWIGSYGGGLGRVKERSGTIFGRAQGLRSDLIRALCLDSKGYLWIGTEGGGLSCLREGTIRSFGAQHGMGADTVVQILEDDANDLWLGTFRGVFQVSRRELENLLAGRTSRVHPRVFGKSDGMLSEQCAPGFGACLKTRAGLLCFATDRGITVIDPRKQRDETALPTVWLEEVLVNGQGQRLSDSLPGNQEAGHDQLTSLKIPPGGQRLEFRYTGLSFSAPDKVRFRYQLQGLDADWVEAGAERAAYYSYVPPGRYQFQVAAHTGDGAWSEAGANATVALAIQPYLWQTGWFQISAALLGLGTAAVGARFVTVRKGRRRLREMERQHALERERARIAKDIHDDLGASLTHITMLTQSARQKLDDSSAANGDLNQIYGTARDLTRAMEEVVWAVSPRHDSLDSLVTYLGTFAQDFAAASQLRCRLDLPPNLSELSLGSQVRHNVFLAFKEALHNVAKHAAASEVRISLKVEAGHFVLLVEDNGRGFRSDEPPSAAVAPEGRPARLLPGNGLANMRSRMVEIGGHCEIQSQFGLGTRVRCVLPRIADLSHK